jgi:AcrR family transcriptional regulator
VARDATATKERLVRAGTRLFAHHGVDRVTIGEIHRAAGQRNASALHYHFGSRDGLLRVILEQHGAVIEAERRDLLAALEGGGRVGDLHALVEILVVPQSRALRSSEGRAFLRILQQIVHRIGIREEHVAATDPVPAILVHVDRCLADVPVALRRERTTVMFHAVAMELGDRARRIDDAAPLALDDETFVGNLIEMSVAALQAPRPTAALAS